MDNAGGLHGRFVRVADIGCEANEGLLRGQSRRSTPVSGLLNSGPAWTLKLDIAIAILHLETGYNPRARLLACSNTKKV